MQLIIQTSIVQNSVFSKLFKSSRILYLPKLHLITQNQFSTNFFLQKILHMFQKLFKILELSSSSLPFNTSATLIQRNISSVRQGISGAIKLETMFTPGCNAFPSVSSSTMPRVSPRTTNEPPHSSFIRFAFASLLVGLVMRCYSKRYPPPYSTCSR